MSASGKKRIAHRIEYFFLKTLHAVFSRLSFKGGKRAAQALYFLVAHVLRYRRKVILQNLHRVYGEELPMERKRLLKGIYRNFVYLWMEVLQTSLLTKENLDEHFDFYNREVLDKIVAEGRGLVLLSGHFGNFEWLAQYFAMTGLTAYGIVKRQSNPYVNELIEAIRTQKGARIIYTKDAMAQGMEALRKKNILALVADQDARHRGVFVDFMGLPSSTPVGPAVFHLRSKAPMYFIASIRKDYGKFDVWIEPVSDHVEHLEVNDENILRITQKHTSALEKWVRKYPDQWFWMHKRWKTRPRDNG